MLPNGLNQCYSILKREAKYDTIALNAYYFKQKYFKL